MSNLFNELKRRNVFRVGLAYVVSAWVIAQVASLVLTSIEAPPWVMQVLLLGLGLGFIIALIISWAYEITPEGIKKEKDVVRDESITNITAKKLDYITLAAATCVLGLFVFQQMKPSSESDNPNPSNRLANAAEAGSQSDNKKLSEPNVELTLTNINTDDKSIAVLPFVDLSPANDQEYFTDGLTENLLHALAQIKEFKVVGRTSSFAYKNKNVDLREIGQTLNVQKILEGSVQKSGDRIRITAQLINADDGIHDFSKTYDRDLVDIFAVQDEITAAVVMSLRKSMLGDSELSGGYKGDYDAYNAYLLGLDFFKKQNQESYSLAIEQFKKAIEIDPNMALAWAGLSETYSEQTGFGTDFAPGFERAREAALKAIELDSKLPEAHLALASVQQSYDWDWAGMETSLLRAYALRPGDADIMTKLAELKLLQGKFNEALNDIEMALAQDPLNERIQRSRVLALMQFGRYTEVLPETLDYVKQNPDRGGIYFTLARIYYAFENHEKALEAAKKEKFNFLRMQLEAIIYDKLNNKTLAEEKLKELIDTYGDDVSWQVAGVYAAWGDPDQAFAALERGFVARDPGLIYIQTSNWFKPYHDDPRYAAFLKKMGFN